MWNRTDILIAAVALFLSASYASGDTRSPAELSAVQEAYQAAITNLVSGAGEGTYEVYVALAGKNLQPELRVKANAKISFDHGKFQVRLDYVKDDVHHLQSRIIVYDGTALVVNRISKRFHPSGSEGEVFDGKPNIAVMRMAGFDYNPCQLPAEIMRVDLISDSASGLNITRSANMDYSGTYTYVKAPTIRVSFMASHGMGYNISSRREVLTNRNDFVHTNSNAVWECKDNVWYVKRIDKQWSMLDGTSHRSFFRYDRFEPNVEVSSSLFKFDALSISPTARLIDRRPDAEVKVLHQPRPDAADGAKLDTLADSVKSLAPRTSAPGSKSWLRYVLFTSASILCALGLYLRWKRKRNRTIAPSA